MMQEHLQHKSLNEMSLAERMEYQRMHDHEVITQAFLQGASVELKSLAKKSIPLILNTFVGNKNRRYKDKHFPEL